MEIIETDNKNEYEKKEFELHFKDRTVCLGGSELKELNDWFVANRKLEKEIEYSQ